MPLGDKKGSTRPRLDSSSSIVSSLLSDFVRDELGERVGVVTECVISGFRRSLSGCPGATCPCTGTNSTSRSSTSRSCSKNDFISFMLKLFRTRVAFDIETWAIWGLFCWLIGLWDFLLDLLLCLCCWWYWDEVGAVDVDIWLNRAKKIELKNYNLVENNYQVRRFDAQFPSMSSAPDKNTIYDAG